MSDRTPKRNKHCSRRFLHPTKGFRTHDSGPRVIDRMGGSAAMMPLGMTPSYKQFIGDMRRDYVSQRANQSFGNKILSKVKGLFSGRGR